MDRDEAYRVVQSASAAALESGSHLRETLADSLEPATLDEVFSLEAFVAGAGWSVDHVARVTVEWLRETRGGW